MNAVLNFLVNSVAAFFSFEGRLNRVQYGTVLLVGYVMPFTTLVYVSRGEGASSAWLLLVPLEFWVLFAAVTKRFHDINKSGWFCLYMFVPLVGQFTPVVLLFYEGDSSENQFGRPPIELYKKQNEGHQRQPTTPKETENLLAELHRQYEQQRRERRLEQATTDE